MLRAILKILMLNRCLTQQFLTIHIPQQGKWAELSWFRRLAALCRRLEDQRKLDWWSLWAVEEMMRIVGLVMQEDKVEGISQSIQWGVFVQNTVNVKVYQHSALIRTCPCCTLLYRNDETLIHVLTIGSWQSNRPQSHLISLCAVIPAWPPHCKEDWVILNKKKKLPFHLDVLQGHLHYLKMTLGCTFHHLYLQVCSLPGH